MAASAAFFFCADKAALDGAALVACFLLFFWGGGAGVGFLRVTSSSDSELSLNLELALVSVEALLVLARPPAFVGAAAAAFFLDFAAAAVAALDVCAGFFFEAFLSAAAAASLARPDPLGLEGLGLAGLVDRFLRFDCFACVAAVGFFVFTSSPLSSLLSLKMSLYLLTPAASEVAALAFEAGVLLVKFEAAFDAKVVGVPEGFTDGDGWDPGEDDAAMAAFLACCALAAKLAIEKAPNGSSESSLSSSDIVADDFFEPCKVLVVLKSEKFQSPISLP